MDVKSLEDMEVEVMGELLTVAEVADELRCRQETIRRYISERRLSALQIPGGGFYRIRREDLEKFLQPVGKGK